MNMYEMRRMVSNAYKGDIWAEKVKRMPDNQVIAVYYSLQKSGRLNKKRESTTIERRVEQLSMFDILLER